METNRFVKAGLKIPDRPVHHDHRRALVDVKNTAEPSVETDDIPGAKPERAIQRPPDDSELDLVGVIEAAFLARAHATPPTNSSTSRKLASTASISKAVSRQPRPGNSAMIAHLKR